MSSVASFAKAFLLLAKQPDIGNGAKLVTAEFRLAEFLKLAGPASADQLAKLEELDTELHSMIARNSAEASFLLEVLAFVCVKKQHLEDAMAG